MVLSIAVKLLVMADQTEVLSIKEVGRRGGLSRARNLTPERRQDIARRAAEARWGKKADSPTPDPTDPKGPGRDHQGAEAGIMLTARRPAVRASSERHSGRSRAAAA